MGFFPPLPTLPQATIVQAPSTQILNPNPRTASAARAPERSHPSRPGPARPGSARLTLRSRRQSPRSPLPHRPPSGSWRACPPRSLGPGTLREPRTRPWQRPGPARQPLAAPSRGRALPALRSALRGRAGCHQARSRACARDARVCTSGSVSAGGVRGMSMDAVGVQCLPCNAPGKCPAAVCSVVTGAGGL